MELKKLSPSFYTDTPTLIQALDFDMQLGQWMAGKIRGHGIVAISINDLTFAIPVHSNIRHGAAFILEVNKQDKRSKGMGLDFAKAMLIKNASHVSAEVFVLRTKAAGKKLIGKQEHVTKQFTDYVEKYIKAYNAEDKHILNSMEYRHTTLVNYHSELGL